MAESEDNMKKRKEMIEEVKKIMTDNYDDFFAEEYDERFDCNKYNKAIEKLNKIFSIFNFEPDEIIRDVWNTEISRVVWEYENSDLFYTTDFSEICALVTKKLV